MKRTTIRDIARIANVSHVTVSLALREHPRIPERTRARIKAIAAQIGYRPDPALSALMVHRRGAMPSGYQGVLAWINAFKQPDRMYRGHDLRAYLEGARERAEKSGYKVEEFCIADLGMDFSKLSKILRARNIQGLLFPPQEKENTRIELDWENFSAISIGFSLIWPRFNVVINAQFVSCLLAVEKLRSLGYRRLGFVTTHQTGERTRYQFLGAFLAAQHQFPVSERIPVLTLPEDRKGVERAFRRWRRTFLPDVVLASDWFEYSWMTDWGKKRQGYGLAHLVLPEKPTEFAGIHQNPRIVGQTAVDTLIAMINANDRGIPLEPRRILIEGRWIDGPSAPRINVNPAALTF